LNVEILITVPLKFQTV